MLAQENPHPPTSAVDRIANEGIRKELNTNSIVQSIPFKNIGPTVFSGRVTDLAVNPKDPSKYYVAYASGGLWYTENNGNTFTPIFDNELVMTIGDIAVDWTTETIWVGTGENNSSRSSYAGLGIYKSSDKGETWTHMGLKESHHISRIIIDPENSDRVYVAVLGKLYSPNKKRGIYITSDGGKTWQQTLYVNDNAGAVDMVMDPANNQVLYAATWERTRRAWDFIESGNGSGIYKSMDGGLTWKRMNDASSGFPSNEGVGRIGLDIYNDGKVSKLFAILDNYNRRPKEEDTKEVALKEQFRSMSKTEFLALTDQKIKDYLEENNFPEKYTAKKVKKMIKNDKIKVEDLVTYLETANSLLFDTPVIGAEVYVSYDNGLKWEKTHEGYLDRVYNSYGYYFGQIR
ncbi:MAG: glycosyl hydrolase, partial [Bacteroidota bacterium]